MGGKASAPPPPDYTPVANASKEAASINAEVGREQLAMYREQAEKDRAFNEGIASRLSQTQDFADQASRQDRARYVNMYQPLENQLVADAADYANGSRMDRDIGRAQAGVGQQFAAQRNNATQNLEAFGVDPTSTRYAALDRGMAAQQAAATASAGNQTAITNEAMGRALRSEAINIGRGLPGQSVGFGQLGIQAGNSAANTALATTSTGAQTMGSPTQYAGLQAQNIAGWGSALNMGYQNQIAQFNANNQGSSGWGSVLGAGLGMAAKFMEEGGEVEADDDMTPGGAIPLSASPSRGRVTDDVPAQLTAGEFVFPKDVMQWKGEEWAQKQIERARTDKKQAVAKPAVGVAPRQQATFVSRPGALPTR
jgi:hypothetical protein